MAKLQSFPSGFDYQEAVQHPDRCFSDSDLRSASCERMAMGLPKMISGNFASVFPMTSASGHKYAIKCFTRRVSHQLQRYELISDRLSARKPWWATDFQYIPAGIQVEASDFPVLRMDWVNGVTLTHWISEHTDRPADITKLAHRFDEMIHDLSASGLAHGDLQAGNLLVTDDGRLHLVDYDGMYVPGLDGLPPDEVGHPDYQSPSRSQSDYGPDMDRFSAWLISLSLKMLAAAPELWDQLNPTQDEYLLLNRHDLRDLDTSPRLSELCLHQDMEVRRLAQVTRQILSLPLAAIPALAVSSPSPGRPAAASPATAPGGIPGWMRSHITEPAGSPAESEAQEPARHGQRTDRWLTWLVRILTALPLLAFAAGSDWQLSLAIFCTLIFLVTMALWLLYRRDPLTQGYAELARARRKAVSGARQISGRISSIQRETAGAGRAERRLVSRHTKEQASLKTDFDRRQQKVSDEIGSIDRQLSQLNKRKQHTIDQHLKQYRQNHLRSRLAQAEVSANNVPGVGAQLAAKLRLAGIRSAADFTGIGYMSNGRSTTVYFRLASGGRAHVAGIGKVKAERIERWRHTQVASAMISQPSALPAPEMNAIDAQFMAEERSLHEQRARATAHIGDQAADIQREFNAAQVDMDQRHQAERTSFDQRKTALAGQLGQAQSDHLAAQQLVLDRQSRLASAERPTFGRFISSALRGSASDAAS
ncbi:MAG: AarF/UbiB family protein [Streptosporangiaceae bacterium]